MCHDSRVHFFLLSRSGSVIQDHSDDGASKEPKNPCPEWISRFLWCAVIRVILDHWYWSGTSQRNTPQSDLGSLILLWIIPKEHTLFKSWSVYSMNYAQNSILLGLRGAWRVCAKNLTNLNKPNFSQLIWINGSLKYILHMVWKLCKKAGECYGFLKNGNFGQWFWP